MKLGASRTQKTVVNSFFLIANRLLLIILSFVLRTAFIKILGDQYTGVASVFTTILATLSLSELGFSTAIATALYRPLKDNNQILIQQIMDFYKKVYRLVAFFIFVVGIMLIPFLHYLIKGVPDIKENITVIYFLYIVKTVSSYLMIYKITLLSADQKLYVVKKLEMLCQIIRYAVEIVVLFVFREYIIYLVLEIASTILQNFIITKRAEREYPQAFAKPKDGLPRETIISLLKDVKALSLYKISGNVGKNIDTILISSFINTSTVAVVGNYTHIKNHVQMILMQFYSAVTPSVGNLAAENNPKKQEKVFDCLLYVSFIMANFCSICIFVLTKPFITIWLGEKYVLGQHIAFIIAFDFFLYILLQVVASFRTANGLFVQGQYRPLVTAICIIVFSIMLIGPYGIFGTVLATVIARLLTQWYDAYLLYKYIFNVSFSKFYCKYWFYIILFLTSAFLTDFFIGKITMGNPLVDLTLGAIICLIIPEIWVLLWTHRSDEFGYAYGRMKVLFSKLR